MKYIDWICEPLVEDVDHMMEMTDQGQGESAYQLNSSIAWSDCI